MTKRALAALLPIAGLALGLLTPLPATASSVIRNPGDPAYRVRLRSDASGHVFSGKETISFRDVGATDLTAIYLRLWSNGVDGCQPKNPIEISRVTGGTAGPLTVDCTAVRVRLDTPVAPGGSGTIGMHVRIEVPRRNDRFGYHGGLALFGTALPTLAIQDDAGWHLDPFVDLGESFYSIVGRYRVAFDLPRPIEVAATGAATAEWSSTSGRHGVTYVAGNVRDFAWAAAGKLHQLHGQVGGTRVVVSYVPSLTSAKTASDSLAVAEHSVRALGSAFGQYPYPEMDVVLTHFASFGGMEYPTIVFTNPSPTTISHEVAHQWWFGIVGDDEYREPWLDESFATWSAYVPFGGWTRCRHYRFPGKGARITDDMGYWATHPGQYGTIYSGGGCLLARLSQRFGYQRFLRILRRYAADHWLGVTRTGDFQSAIARAAASDLPHFNVDAFWRHWRVGEPSAGSG